MCQAPFQQSCQPTLQPVPGVPLLTMYQEVSRALNLVAFLQACPLVARLAHHLVLTSVLASCSDRVSTSVETYASSSTFSIISLSFTA